LVSKRSVPSLPERCAFIIVDERSRNESSRRNKRIDETETLPLPHKLVGATEIDDSSQQERRILVVELFSTVHYTIQILYVTYKHFVKNCDIKLEVHLTFNNNYIIFEF